MTQVATRASSARMLFADTTLAARIERAECALLSDCAASIAARRPEARVFAQPIAGGFAAFTGEGSPLNKVAGLGFAPSPDLDALARELDVVERELAARGAPVQVELSCLAAAGTGALLTRRGYALVGFENVLGRPVHADASMDAQRTAGGARRGAQPGRHRVEVRPSGDDEIALWLGIVCDGFAAPDSQGVASHESFDREALESAIRDMATIPGVTRYLALLDSVPAGGAAMRLHDGICGLHGAATLPAHRRRGVQSAMLARRLADAAGAGCDVAVVTTLPGSKSQQNVQRLGFELLYTRAILVREP